MSRDMEALLRDRGALLEGHFLLSSGLHSDRYVQCARLFEDPRDGQALGLAMAARAPAADVVVSPALGGLLIGYEVARARAIPFLFTERAAGKMELRRGFSLRPGQRVLVVEDVLTTGRSALEVLQIARAIGAVPIAALAIIDRGVDPESLGVPVRSLLRLDLRTAPSEACALCRSGAPLVKPGSRPQPTC